MPRKSTTVMDAPEIVSVPTDPFEAVKALIPNWDAMTIEEQNRSLAEQLSAAINKGRTLSRSERKDAYLSTATDFVKMGIESALRLTGKLSPAIALTRASIIAVVDNDGNLTFPKIKVKTGKVPEWYLEAAAEEQVEFTNIDSNDGQSEEQTESENDSTDGQSEG